MFVQKREMVLNWNVELTRLPNKEFKRSASSSKGSNLSEVNINVIIFLQASP